MHDEAHKPYTEGPMHSTTPVIDPGLTFASVTDKISSIVLKRKTSLAWFFGFAISFALFQLMLLTITNLLFVGIDSGASTFPSLGELTFSTLSGGSESATRAR